MKTTFLITLAALLLVVTNAFAFTVPIPTGFITDTTGMITPSQLEGLNAKLANYKTKSQNEIAVVVVPTLGGEELADVGQQIFNTYKIGQAGLDNGVLLLIAVKDHKMRLQTGKGVEGEITDIQSSDILNSLKPYSKANNFGGGIDVAITKIMALLDSRNGQKAAPGTGQQFNQPIVDPNAPSHNCDVGNGTISDVGASGLLFSLVAIFGLMFYFWRRSTRSLKPSITFTSDIPVEKSIYTPKQYVAPVLTIATQVATTATYAAIFAEEQRLEQERFDRACREQRARDVAIQEEMDRRAASHRHLRQQEEESAALVVPVITDQDDEPIYEAPVQVDDSPSADNSPDDGGFGGGNSGGGGADSSF